MMQWRHFWRRSTNWLAVFIVALFFFTAAAAPWLAPPSDPDNPSPFKGVARSFDRLPKPPSEGILLGTVPQIKNLPQYGIAPGQDAYNEWDVFYTVIWGTRSALRFGIVTTVLAATIGIIVGSVSAYLGGAVDRLLMGITDAFLAFPILAAVWVVQRTMYSQVLSFFPEPESWRWWEHLLNDWKISPIMITLILFAWMPYARMINATIAQIRQADYVQASVALGSSGPAVWWRHLLPNAISPIVVLMARDVGGMVVLATTFVYIGFGGDIAWAIMLVAAKDYVIGLGGNPFIYWWSFVPVVVMVTLFALGWNLLGDGLNEALNPRHTYVGRNWFTWRRGPKAPEPQAEEPDLEALFPEISSENARRL
ncbi:MAG: ABC transporter permease [Anaerolineales bacterium]|nr:ABC transporter permease [Anaerolineales bacterium]